MATDTEEDRAILLAEQAIDLVASGKIEEGSRALKEAASLAPQNARVKDAFVKIHYDESIQPLMRLCRKYKDENDVTAGKEALWVLSSTGAQIPPGVAAQCFQLVVEADKVPDRNLKDDLVAALLYNCLGARSYLAKKLQESVSLVFEQIFAIGDGAANGITVVSLDPAAWASETSRRNCEKDMFLLFLAKLLESGYDHDGRAVKGISRHLAVDAERLHEVIDEESFDAILVCLDYRLSPEIRSQATLAVAKYLEASKSTGEQYLTRFIATRTARHQTEDLVLAFSVAAAVFAIATPVVAQLFLIDGFLPSLIPLLDKKSRPIKVEKAALDMLSAACIDGACRQAIAKHCSDWMHHVMEDEEDERHGQAAVILAKVQDVSEHKHRRTTSIVDVVPRLKGMLLTHSEMDQRTAIEGLAYASMQPSVKEEIAHDPSLLKRLLQLPKKDSITSAAAFGSLTLLSNLSRYLPKLSEEQQQMSQLKAYANASKDVAKSDPLDDDVHVSNRCEALIDAEIVPFLVILKSNAVSSGLSPASLTLIGKILLALAQAPSSRGRIAQQGALPLLLQLYKNSALDSQSRQAAAHAIARILISVDPRLISAHVRSTIPALVSLLSPSDDGDRPRDLLPAFEALLALTNLVSDPAINAGPDIIRNCFHTIEDLLLHHNQLLQRASTELVCNLMTCPEGIEKFADGSPAAGRRLHVLLALADVDDLATRQAAGGALAGITEFGGAVKPIVERERGVDILFGLCTDHDQGCVHRGVVCVRNMVMAEGAAGTMAKARLREKGGIDTLKEVLKATRDPAVLETAAEALRALMA